MTVDIPRMRRAAVLAPNLPVYLSLQGLARTLDVHHMQAIRAFDRGYIEPVVYVDERPAFDSDALVGLRRFMEAHERNPASARLKRHWAQKKAGLVASSPPHP